MSDIVERLRDTVKYDLLADAANEAADEITRLRETQHKFGAVQHDLLTQIDTLRQYLDAAQRRGEELRAQVAALEVALQGVLPWVVTQKVACNGLKCREAVCMSCDSDSEANAQLACNAYAAASDALAARKGEA